MVHGAMDGNLADFFAHPMSGVSRIISVKDEAIYSQGDPADAVFYLHRGRVKMTLTSAAGKERIIALFQGGDFIGTGCLSGRRTRRMSTIAMTDCSLTRIEKPVMLQLLAEEPAFSDKFISFLVDRSHRYEDDLLDHMTNNSEKRLARVLLILSDTQRGDGNEVVMPKISQETLAEIVGTTRPRINFFMIKFRQMGLIEYQGTILVRRDAMEKFLLEETVR